jgi:hypothetical protein
MNIDLERITVEKDFESVVRYTFYRHPLDPHVARRVQERAEHVTESLRISRGIIDDATFESILETDAPDSHE